jgi:uncharacterized membrane protein SirB2
MTDLFETDIGKDPLDRKMDGGPSVYARQSSRWFRSRLALGLSPTPIPGLVLVAGLVIGPQGINLLSGNMLSYLDPAVSAALAALGVLIGLGFDLRRSGEIRLLGAATVEAALVMVLVGAGVVLVQSVQPVLNVPIWLMAVILGICASASSTVSSADSTSPDSVAARIADLDDVLPIVLGGLALAAIREVSPASVTWLTVQCIGLAVAVAYGAWLLVTQSTSESEQRVFTIGAILLLAGIAEFLSISALWIGLVGGVVWNLAHGNARERIAVEIRYIQHPLVMLLLLIAGARARSSGSVAILIVIYTALRLIGKVGAWRVVRWIVPRKLPPHFGLSLISPGVIAVAFALNVQSTNADGAGELLSIVVGGSIVSEVISRIMKSRGEP